MAFRPVESFKGWWSTTTPRQQKVYMIIATGSVIILAAMAMSQFTPKTRRTPTDKRVESTVMLPQRKDLTAESLQSQMTSLQNQVRDIMAYLRSVDNNVKTANDNINAKIDQKLEDVVSSKTLQEKIERAVEGKVLESNERNHTPAPPPGGGSGARLPGGAAPDAGAALPSYAPGPTLPAIGAGGANQPGELTGVSAPGGVATSTEPRDDAGSGQMRIGGRQASSGRGASIGGSGIGASGSAGLPSAPGTSSGATLVPGIGNSSEPPRTSSYSSGGGVLGKPRTGGGGGAITKAGDHAVAGTGNETARDAEDGNRGGDSVQLTAGAIFSGVLLNGMDAPTSQTAQRNPTPVVIRIKHEAILPNRYKSTAVKECFVLAGGYGVLSTERANMRTETITCIMANGKVFEGKLDGYAVGEDGKVGMRGRLVTKQGAAIANAMIAGVLAGIGNSMAQGATNATNVASGGFLYSTASAQDVLQNGAYQGVGQALNTVAKFYTDMAKEMFPVVEIDAGRAVTIVLIKGINLRSRP